MKTQYLDINQIYKGRSELLMKNINPGSVSLSFWSPPYFVGKEYEKNETLNSWENMLREVIHLHYKVLKPGGFMVINIADILCFKDKNIPKFQALNIHNQKVKVTRDMVLEAVKLYPTYNRYQLAKLLGCSEQTIDRRLHGNNIRGGKYQDQTRVRLVGAHLEKSAYEVGIFLYDRRIWVKDPTWANSKWTTNSFKAVSEYEDLYVFWKPGQQIINRKKLSQTEWREWGSRGVWYLDSVRKNDLHEAQFPLALADRVVRLYSDPNDLVLDPFMGSGTTALASIKNNRNYIGIEKEEKYVNLSKRKIQEYIAQQRLID